MMIYPLTAVIMLLAFGPVSGASTTIKIDLLGPEEIMTTADQIFQFNSAVVLAFENAQASIDVASLISQEIIVEDEGGRQLSWGFVEGKVVVIGSCGWLCRGGRRVLLKGGIRHLASQNEAFEATLLDILQGMPDPFFQTIQVVHVYELGG